MNLSSVDQVKNNLPSNDTSKNKLPSTNVSQAVDQVKDNLLSKAVDQVKSNLPESVVDPNVASTASQQKREFFEKNSGFDDIAQVAKENAARHEN